MAIAMDGNGRWAQMRGQPRSYGHERGEPALLDVIQGGLELGIETISAYAFSTENWRRSPDEVRWLMGFSREIIRRRRDDLIDLGARIVWSGRRFIRSSGEHRTSNFMMWQAVYAELVFLDVLWPDFDRRHLWAACEAHAARSRRFGGRP